MKSTLRLNKSIFVPGGLKRAVNKVLTKAATELEDELKNNIDSSTPAGRIYRRGPITARKTQYLLSLGYKKQKGTPTRVIVGYRYHQASGWGQPPARDTNKLYRSLRVVRNGGNGITARVKAPGVKFLDSEVYLNRPFFKSVINAYYQKRFKLDIQQEIRSLL